MGLHCVLFVYKEEIREPSVKLMGGVVVGRGAPIIFFGIMCPRAFEKSYFGTYMATLVHLKYMLYIIKYAYV